MLELFLIWLGGGIWFLSNMILRPKKLSNNRIYRIGAKTGRFNETVYKNSMKKQFMILSDYGYFYPARYWNRKRQTGYLLQFYVMAIPKESTDH